MTTSGINSGNQFVWIPVKSEEDLEVRNKTYKEPYTSGYSAEMEDHETMKQQVLKYNGFYVGRYEAGVNTTTFRTKVTVAQTVVSKKGVAPYNYVPWGNSMSNIGSSASPSGAVYLSKNMYETSNSVNSNLVFGAQWDAIYRYIQDVYKSVTVKSGVQLTGSSGTDIQKNIYDLAGNCTEWTMLSSGSTLRLGKGGFSHQDAGNVTMGYNYIASPSAASVYYGFRVALNIK